MQAQIYYVLKYLKLKYYVKMIGAIMLLILLPSVAFGAYTWGMLSILPMPDEHFLQGLADKNLGYWFIALAGIAITSWTFVGKWLLKQLEQQRVANQDTTSKLINYMDTGHTAMISALTEGTIVQRQTTSVLEKVLEKLNKP